MRTLLRNMLLFTTAVAALGGATASASAADPVKVLTIGYPDEDSLDPVTGAAIPGIGHLKEAYAAANPDNPIEIINIPWGTGSTGYAPKTEAMMKSGEACLYEMPGYAGYGRRGELVDLSTLIEADAHFNNVWGRQLEPRFWGPDSPNSLFYIPDGTGLRVFNWDAKLFADWGVEPLSKQPTLAEIEEKAIKMTGLNPVTGEQNYGYWYQGKYAVWQFLAIAHSLGANWGGVDDKGTLTVNWDTPEYLEALTWFVKMAAYAPTGALGGDGMPQGFMTDQNVVAIIPEGEQGYFIAPLIATPELRDRFRASYNLKGADGLGGLNSVSPLVMAANCDNKDSAWEAMKWLAGDPAASKFFFDASGRLPVTEDGGEAVPALAALPDGDVILNQPLTAEAPYPWAGEQPRWALQTALEGALAGIVTPAEALKQAQVETADWLAQQQPQ